MNLHKDFMTFACQQGVLKFGSFVTKAGRTSPYFFNAGLFNDGMSFKHLCYFYAQRILASNLSYDMLFGPAYKGIPLVTGIAMELAAQGINKPFAFNRKEAKDHGEGGLLIGAPLKGNILIVDDVVSAGTSVRESIALIQQQGAKPVGVLIALDRMEKGHADISAVQEIEQTFAIPVIAVAKLNDLIEYLKNSADFQQFYTKVQDYRAQYGV